LINQYDIMEYIQSVSNNWHFDIKKHLAQFSLIVK
jgi:hypothetical protein